jgi:ATP-dependent Clp protease, protease subunit
MLNRRRVMLWGQVDDDSARHVIERLLYLEDLGPEKEIQLIINSPGGYVTSGFAIYDTLKAISSPVATICAGFAASMGAILFSAGEKGKRFVLPHARVMIHQPSGGTRGNSSDIEIQAAEIMRSRDLGARLLAENCGQPMERVLRDFNRDYFMDAREAVSYGIADAVLTKL